MPTHGETLVQRRIINNKKKRTMKAFFYTTIAAFALLIFSSLTIAVLKVEKQKTQIEAHTNTIDSLTTELHTMEVMYLKCVGSVEAEQHGAHYSGGKLKFYKTK